MIGLMIVVIALGAGVTTTDGIVDEVLNATRTICASPAQSRGQHGASLQVCRSHLIDDGHVQDTLGNKPISTRVFFLRLL